MDVDIHVCTGAGADVAAVLGEPGVARHPVLVGDGVPAGDVPLLLHLVVAELLYLCVVGLVCPAAVLPAKLPECIDTLLIASISA